MTKDKQKKYDVAYLKLLGVGKAFLLQETTGRSYYCKKWYDNSDGYNAYQLDLTISVRMKIIIQSGMCFTQKPML